MTPSTGPYCTVWLIRFGDCLVEINGLCVGVTTALLGGTPRWCHLFCARYDLSPSLSPAAVAVEDLVTLEEDMAVLSTEFKKPPPSSMI